MDCVILEFALAYFVAFETSKIDFDDGCESCDDDFLWRSIGIG